MLEVPEKEIMGHIADLFKGFADTTRVRILYELTRGELCVTDIAQGVELSQSAVSHQLRILRQARLVKSRKDGRVVYYSLDDDHIDEIFALAFAHIMEEREG